MLQLLGDRFLADFRAGVVGKKTLRRDSLPADVGVGMTL